MTHDDQDPDAGHIGEVRPRNPQKQSVAGVFIA